ncbi:hypothetical protein TWF506_004736 [Arthrobotrys conoides]|uniref:Uncharacterized protein n=1 Tax=Arthrobotrys conoides TaxID=74498 RepID=A0AAN8MWH1_9PEZI
MKTTSLPYEIWNEIFGEFTFTEIQKTVRPINRHLHGAYGNNFHGLSPNLWEKVFENLDHKDIRTGIVQTCTVFRGIVTNTKSPAIKETLFREYLPPNTNALQSVKDASGVKTHPVFSSLAVQIKGRHGLAEDEVWIRGAPAKPLGKYKVGKKNATSPPVDKLVVALPGWGRSITLDSKKIAAQKKRKADRPAFPDIWRAHKRMKAKQGDVSGGVKVGEGDGPGAQAATNALAPSAAITVTDVMQGVFELVEKGLVKKDLKEAMEVDFTVDEDTPIWRFMDIGSSFAGVERVKIQGGRNPKVRLDMGGLD